MANELILCVPGDWRDRADLVRRVITVEPEGRYVFAGTMLADVQGKDHVSIELFPADPNLPRAFAIAGQGRISEEILAGVRRHSAVAYLRFPMDLKGERKRVLAFTSVLHKAGGLAVKVESSGIAHAWNRWDELLAGTPFDLYSAAVVLVRDEDFYHSCGMHLFGLAGCAVPRTVPGSEAADLMNRFNFWRIVDAPVLADGHTFSLTANAPRFRMRLERDTRHETGDPFYNAHGVWCLRAAGDPSSN